MKNDLLMQQTYHLFFSNVSSILFRKNDQLATHSMIKLQNRTLNYSIVRDQRQNTCVHFD
jgi:hypothetical protein